MPNSELDTDIISISDVTDEQLNALNRSLLTIWGETVGRNMRLAKTNFNTEVGVSDYALPSGNIIKNGVKLNGTLIPFVQDIEELAERSGTPDRFTIQGDKLVFYPTPNAIMTVNLKYRTKYAVLTSENVAKSTFASGTDVLNISERIEDEFINCLGHLTNQLLNGKPTSKYYAEHEKRYITALQLLKMVDEGTEDSYPSISIG